MTIHEQDKIEFPCGVKIPILIDNSFPVLKRNSYVRGYYPYMDIWTPIIGNDTRSCKREKNNPYIENTVDLLEMEPHIVGHVPFLLFINVQEMSFSSK